MGKDPKGLGAFLESDDGLTSVECALVFAVIVIVCLAAITAINKLASSLNTP